MTRVFLVDDHEIVRRGVAELLEREADLEVVGEAGTVAQALARIEATSPDVALLDMRLPDGDGIDLCRELRSRHPPRATCRSPSPSPSAGRSTSSPRDGSPTSSPHRCASSCRTS